MGNVIHRGKGSFTHVENTVFFDRELSLKAKGIYCQIRSLEGNPEWVFTIRGFASLVKDGVDSVSAGIRELESAGYVIRARRRGEAGRFLKAEEATPRCTTPWPTSCARRGSPSSPSSSARTAPRMRATPRRKAAASRKLRLSPERENPYLVRPHPGKPHPENPDLENPALLITHG